MATKFLNTIKFPGLDDTYVVNDLSIIAPDYDDTKEYKIGNLLTYLGKQYEVTGDDGVAPPVGTLPTDMDYFTERPVSEIIDMIKNGTIVTGHSQVADNLTPYSEDSGTTQENPFISQGTGTDNNSVIVTTGAIARQLEKQGNTLRVCQLVQSVAPTSTTSGITFTKVSDSVVTMSGTATARVSRGMLSHRISVTTGHAYFIKGMEKNTQNIGLIFNAYNGTTYVTTYSGKDTGDGILIINSIPNVNYLNLELVIENGTELAKTYSCEPKVFDLTGWRDSILTDLTSHPEHFSWYYNGSLAYDAGSLQNCNGRYLECGQGRNLFDQQTELSGIIGGVLNSKNYILVVPNTTCYFRSSASAGIAFYDKDKQEIRRGVTNANTTFVIPSNCQYIRFYCSSDYGTTYKNDISVELYYTPEQGGEGYGEMHDYIAPIRIDTGSETLKAFDKKLPSGVIERNTGEVDLGTLNWTYNPNTGNMKSQDIANIISNSDGKIDIKCAKYVPVSYPTFGNTDKTITHALSYLVVRDTNYTDATAFKAAMSGVMLEYELNDASKTTEQGTLFSEYAQINDYSYMAWFDSDGNLVSIPQGCKLFYPVDYKGFVDDLVMYTNGDATALAKNEDIADAALNARGYYKMQDLSSNAITEVTGLTYAVKRVYKNGNIITLTLRIKNETGSDISANTPLGTLATGLFDSTYGLQFVANTDNDIKAGVINTLGSISLKDSFANNDSVRISITYAVS